MSPHEDKPRSACPINYALEIFGDRWTLLVLRDLIMKSRNRYRDLLACEEGIATSVLADRLKRLERRGLIAKERDAQDLRQFVYRPTETAVALVPMIVEMIAWGLRNNPGVEEGVEFMRRFEDDREALIDDIVEKVRKAADVGCPAEAETGAPE